MHTSLGGPRSHGENESCQNALWYHFILLCLTNLIEIAQRLEAAQQSQLVQGESHLLLTTEFDLL